MSRYWNPDIAGLSPYVPGEQPRLGGLVKLNTNEMPQGPSPTVLASLREAATDTLRLYPDPQSSALREAFATQLGVQAEQVFVGNGSDEVLAHVFKALFRRDAPLLFPDISYSFYPVYGHFFGLNCETVALNDEFEIDLQDYRRANGGIIFPNPNAPTGVFTELAAVRELLQFNRDSVVVVDEAYVDFGGESAVTLIDEFPNLLVVQTLSKSRALAGLRVGAAIGHVDLIAGLTRVKDSFNSYPLGTLAQVGAIAALQDVAWFEENCQLVMRNRETLAAQLRAQGFQVLPSRANFLFVRHSRRYAPELYQALRERGVLVRHFAQPRIDNFLRITIGTEAQCATLVAALQAILDSD